MASIGAARWKPNNTACRDVVQRFEQGGKAEPFDPYALIEDRQSMVSLLDEYRFDQLNSQPGLRATWDDSGHSRAELVNYLDLLIAEPIALLYTDERARQAMARYLDAYAELLRLLAIHRGDLNARFSVWLPCDRARSAATGCCFRGYTRREGRRC